jgi:inner membrane protein
MSPITHFLSGWLVAHSASLDRRDRAIVTFAAVIPDLDGFGLPVEILTRNSSHPLTWWSDFHHVLGHNIGFALLVTALAAACAKRRALTTFLVFGAFHLHLFCDLIGAKGPDGHQWPIPYLLPFSPAWQWAWDGQWALNAWPNFVVTLMFLAATLYLAWQKGYSPLEIASTRIDAQVVHALRARFGRPKHAAT